ncbi:TetR family transcriptional regulator [Variovorax paradoxus]|nr:TetR family transcriptional regulator [Variovorax paradoxus]MBT2300687.1 TetR family transcriptional regulator [Variovorax paradoxus]
MRVSREQASENRERVLDTAAKLFRERGFGGVGVAELMKAAGLTHGGFYGQFESKEDLMAQACARASETMLKRWREAAARSPDDPLAALVASYVSASHRDEPGGGCIVPALGAEAVREGPKVRRVVAEGAKSLLETLVGVVPGKSRAEKRQRAAVTLASMVGAVVLARALDDDALSKEILRAVRTAASS